MKKRPEYGPEAKKIRLLLAYDGSYFGGWQKQRDGDPLHKPTVQGELEEKLSRFFNEKIRVIGSGRTDAGVHALGQNAHFVAPKTFKEKSLLIALNKMTTRHLAVLEAWEVPMSFHALGAAEGKIYRYNIWNKPTPNPFLSPYSTWINYPLDIAELQACADFFVGKHDFSSFQTAGSEVLTTVREIYSAQWTRKGSRLKFTIHGEGFLKQMVRNIVGLQLDFVRQKRDPRDILKILAAKTRQAAGSTAPPEGLFLVKVLYPGELDNQCRKL